MTWWLYYNFIRKRHDCVWTSVCLLIRGNISHSFFASWLLPLTSSVCELTPPHQLIKNTTEWVREHWEFAVEEMRRRCHLSPELRLFINETRNKSLHFAFCASSPCRCADRNRARHDTQSKTNTRHKQNRSRRPDGCERMVKLKANTLVIHLASAALNAWQENEQNCQRIQNKAGSLLTALSGRRAFYETINGLKLSVMNSPLSLTPEKNHLTNF